MNTMHFCPLRKMPWYSTTDQQHPAFHLQIVNNPLKGAFLAASNVDNSDAANNNDDDDEKVASNGHVTSAASPRRGACVSSDVITANGVSPRKKKGMLRQESCPVSQVRT